MLGGLSNVFHAHLTGFLSHGIELRVGRKLRNRLWKVLVQRIAAFLLNLTSFWRRLVAMTIVESWLFHRLFLLAETQVLAEPRRQRVSVPSPQSVKSIVLADKLKRKTV